MTHPSHTHIPAYNPSYQSHTITSSTKKSRKPMSFRDYLVGLTGFEPATP